LAPPNEGGGANPFPKVILMSQQLTVTNAHKRFNSGSAQVANALAGVDITARAGNVTSIVGPNGSGKTTLLKAIAGLLQLDLGNVTIAGYDGPRPLPEFVSLLLETSSGFYPRLTVAENLIYFASLHGVNVRELKRTKRNVLKRVNLDSKSNEQVQRLSKGMQQRLSLAVLMTAGSPIKLLDEPTVGLDLEETESFYEIIREITEEEKCVTILTSHRPETVLALSQQIYMFRDGRAARVLKREEIACLDEKAFRNLYFSVVKRDNSETVTSERMHEKPAI
jgi:ABC-2 type transport system ATP-binding protein